MTFTNQTESFNMHICAKTQTDQLIRGIGSIISVNLVSEFGSDKVYTAVSGLESDETHILDVSSEFKFPFQRKDQERSKILYRLYY